ncbi:putative thioredoxin-disulfide reductase [Burkholderia pseudomallei MSHR2451]|nr:putative thioredoxin-disulfide reductase [Burkholderia pseudomallei MSHR2451]
MRSPARPSSNSAPTGAASARGAQPAIRDAFSVHADVRHLKIEDGPGRPLGRSFGIKLWPTLVFLRDGTEVARVVRPTHAEQIETIGFAALV